MEKDFIVKDKENERTLSSDFTENRSKPPRAPSSPLSPTKKKPTAAPTDHGKCVQITNKTTSNHFLVIHSVQR
jgi:hypothetical protein